METLNSYCRLLTNFLFAGSSALLLSIISIYPELWFLSLFALIPFLWRTIAVTLLESVGLAIILATTYCLVISPITLWASPVAFLPRIIGLNILLALYAAAVNRIAKHIGFNAVFVALLWLPFEYSLSRLTGLGGILMFPEANSTFLIKLGSLFGMLIVSLVVVLINSLIVVLAKNVGNAMPSHSPFFSKEKEAHKLSYDDAVSETLWYNLPDSRAPPPA